MTSLLPFDPSGAGSDLRSWSLVAKRLEWSATLDCESADQIAWLEAFGHLIANTDMHLANLSLRVAGTRLRGLAPVYDMLPMFHAPRHGGELPRGLYQPRAERDSFPEDCKRAARTYWDAVIARRDVSRPFREIAAAQRRLISS